MLSEGHGNIPREYVRRQIERFIAVTERAILGTDDPFVLSIMLGESSTSFEHKAELALTRYPVKFSP